MPLVMSTVSLSTLLWQALNDGAVYSALVPWILDTRQQAPTLSLYVQQKQALQHQQLQAPNAVPRDFRVCVMAAVERSCSHARTLNVDECSGIGGTKAHSSSTAQQGLIQSSSTSCTLSQPAARLAKIHGHMLAHGLVHDLSEQLQMLMLLMLSAPLQPSSKAPTAPTKSSSRSQNSTSKKQHHQAPDTAVCAAAEGESAAAAAKGCDPIKSPEQLITCRTCAARYAAKALECCSKLLCCMPEDVVHGLANNPYLQQYAPGLAALLTKTATSSKSAAALSRNTYVTGNSSQQAGLDQQQQQTPHTPAASTVGITDRSRTVAPSNAGLSSAGGPWSGGLGGRRSSGSGGAKLSGLGMLVHNTPGSAGGRSTGGQGSAVRPNNAAICNREKSRDTFFSILRRCSSRLEALRQQQAATAGLQDYQQQAAAAAVFNTELQELIAEVGLAAKQLLLQLAPSNQVYLAELFTACVLQAANTGEPILEPQLALMAERDPGKFHKLQQRLADRTGGPGAASPIVAGALAATGPGSRQQGAGQYSKPSPAGGSAGKMAVQRVTPQSVPSKQQQQATGHANSHVQQQQLMNGLGGASHGNKRHGKPVAQGLAATGLMYKMPPGSSNSTGASTGKQLSSVPRQIKPTPSSAGDSTGNSFRLAAAAGLSTPVPFASAAGAAGQSPGTSPLMQSSTVLPPVSEAAAAVAGASDVTPVLQQQYGSSQGRSILKPSVSRVVQLSGNSADAPAGVHGLMAGKAAVGSLHQSPASAGAAGHTLAADTPSAAAVAPGSVPPKAPNSVPHTVAAAAAQQLGSLQVVQQLLADMPAGQHVLVLVLHAADSASFNRSLLKYMLTRTEQLLSSGPASLAATGGLGQQTSAIMALASYCSYLSFAAGAVQGSSFSSTTSSSSHMQHHQQHVTDSDAGEQQPLLQQQPVLDVAGLLQRAADTTSDSSSLIDLGWRVALAVPFICSYLHFVQFNPSAASSASVASVIQQLLMLQGLPCMNSNHPAYGSLPACISACLHRSGLLQQSDCNKPSTQVDGEAVERKVICQVSGVPKQQQQQQQQRQQHLQHNDATANDMEGISSDWWCSVLQQGSQFVDSTYWSICCPGLQQLSNLLATTPTTALPAQRLQQQKGAAHGTSRPSSGSSSKPPLRLPAEPESPSTKQPVTAAEDAAAASGAASDVAERDSTSPAGSTASLRHTTPLLLAPREPPVIEKPPASITAALAEVKDPLRQQLQQAFLGQYSTDDNPVKMRDVLSLVSNILCANSLSLALCHGVPPVMQQHLDSMSQEVQDQLGPVGATGRVPLQGQDLARAIHTVCCKHSLPAARAALESAMRQASQHADHAATAACTALLPADVPPAAAAAAAALVAASCKASCAQRLLQEIPVLTQSSLADQADELVKLVTRQWAMHSRITAPAASAGPAADAFPTSSGATIQAGGSTEPSIKAVPVARRINPVMVADAGTAIATELQNCNLTPLAVQQQKLQSSTAAAFHTGDVAESAAAPAASSDRNGTSTSQGKHSGAVAELTPSKCVKPCMVLHDADAAPSSGVGSNIGRSKDSNKQDDSIILCASSSSSASTAPDLALQQEGTVQAASLFTSTAVTTPEGTADSAVVATLVSLASSAKASAHSITCSAGARQLLDSMQLDVADAVAQGSISKAMDVYLEATRKLLPRSQQNPAGVDSNARSACYSQQAKQHQQPQQQQEPDSSQQPMPKAPGPALDVQLLSSVASSAAQVLVAGLTARLYSLLQLEQQLVQLVDPRATLDPQPKGKAAATAATAPSSTTSCVLSQPCQQAANVTDSGMGPGMSMGMQDSLCHLLAGAVVHAYMTNPRIRASVWGSSTGNSKGSQHEGSISDGVQHFTSLPTVIMKAARTDKPAWLMRQLRHWIQETTLGC